MCARRMDCFRTNRVAIIIISVQIRSRI
ncbi:unnamed protein product [Notodromas monacha]|uniref:Uncharacterized protein n=1 Tax=Notodromas monacha TaxID=399045 RepID=A0A7R9C1W9_9CRUS|nr:unnamed protein product [Notodromas monacha]CAG0925880.1 unnamed protein product [Notodromas monacha]